MSRRERFRPERRLTAEELAVWQAAMGEKSRSGSEVAAHGPGSDAAQATTLGPAPIRVPKALRRPLSILAPRRLDPKGPVDLDRRTWQRLQRGRMRIEASLDLHGLTQEEAYRTLAGFLQRMQAAGARCVLVITGRGLRTGGILRQAVPEWLDAPPMRGLVLAWGPARAQHGGEGALYILLRRRRDRTTES